MPYWNQSKRYKALNEKKASKKTQNSFMNAFSVLRQKSCDHILRDGRCIKCGIEEACIANEED